MEIRGGYRNLRRGVPLKECEKFRATMPTFAKPHPKLAFVSCTRNRLLHCMHVELNCTEIIQYTFIYLQC